MGSAKYILISLMYNATKCIKEQLSCFYYDQVSESSESGQNVLQKRSPETTSW